ncbi:pol-like protein [Apostichopus japonicus]|uniref:Pol-like protein n=1 Tax=Stichopus japonicus TaxID=307972 RepID=A0A2G8KHT3_STIJA|nr:pol-like protein [Apostichopus japonicus]
MVHRLICMHFGVFLDEKLHGARVRARIQFVEADEKPTIRFYRDDTKSVVDRRIRAVCHPGGVVVESPQAVLGVFGSFFSNLYSRAAVSEDLQEDLLSGIDKAPPESKNDSLGSNLSVGELWTAVAAMKKGKSPGPDGLPAEFYRTFWEVLGGDLRDVFATAFQLNYMSQTQRVGNIVLLPKSGDPLDPRNRRPITLLNVDYKILAKALGNRLSDVCRIFETLSTSLDRCFGFRPFNVPGGARVKCVQYADDVTCIVSDLASFKPLSKVLTTFQEATGARLNKSKTKGLRLGGTGVGFFFDTTGPDPFPITGQRRHALLGSILRLVTLFVESKKRVGHMFC